MSSALSGPKPRFIWGHLLDFGHDPLAFLERSVREYGDFVSLRFLHRPVFILNHPDQLEYVLGSHSRNFRKTIGYQTPIMRRLFGHGLLTSEGELWQRQRKLAQPAFHRERIANYAEVVVDFTTRTLNQWKSGQTRAIHVDMRRLTTEVVTKTLFNSDVPSEINQLGEASGAVMHRFAQQWTGWRLLLNLLPTPSGRRFEKVIQQLDAFILGLISERRTSGHDAGDLLSMLLHGKDEEGRGMSDQQLRDELTTLMVAGLDTTALALSWSLYLLSKNPAVDASLAAELLTVLGGRRPQFSDLPQLRYTELVVKEAMRLYPPAWVIGREAIQDCEIAGYRVPAGASLPMSQWLKHRDSRYFEAPEKFLPERWESESVKKQPKFIYFPFGAGPRICIGSAFAMLEAVLGLATVAQRFRMTAPSDYVVSPWPAITLQPKGGIHLRIEERVPSSESIRLQTLAQV